MRESRFAEIASDLWEQGVVGVSLFMDSAGWGSDWLWLALVGGGLLGVVWLVIAGFWLVLTPKQDAAATGPLPAGT